VHGQRGEQVLGSAEELSTRSATLSEKPTTLLLGFAIFWTVTTERWATFDCYGTLVDWLGGMRAALQAIAPNDAERLLRAYHELEPAVQGEHFRCYRDVLAGTLRRAAAREGVALSPEGEHVLAETLPGWPVFDDVAPALTDLREAGWRLAILSNVDDDLIAATLSRLEVPVDLVVSAERVRSYKPALGHFETFRRESGVAEGAWVHVAQSLFHDIAPARRLGLPSVWVNRQDEADPGTATVTVPTLERLAETLDPLVH
jgi:2-haloacid dehalogenase